jgi:hypothetical protein
VVTPLGTPSPVPGRSGTLGGSAPAVSRGGGNVTTSGDDHQSSTRSSHGPTSTGES